MKSKPKQQKGEVAAKKEKPVRQSLFDKAEEFFEGKKTFFLIAAIFLSVVLAVFQFNYRISEANDDSMYLESAYKFSQNFFGYYTANAPFYPMFLSFIIMLFGFRLLILKLTGVVFMVVHLFFLFKAFEKRMPYYIVFFIVLLTAINSYMLYYASMTFSEQFFLMQQGLFFFLFFKAYDKINSCTSFLSHLVNWLPTGLCLFVLSMSRNVGVGIIIPVAVFFVFDKRWMQSVYFVLAFVIFRVPFEIFRKAMWGSQDQFGNQFTTLIRQKDPYDVTKGVEDFGGFIERFTGNYGLYICKRFYQILGFLAEDDAKVRQGLGFIFFVLVVISAVIIFRSKNKYVLFTLLYTGALTCITFFALQTRWDQLRLILVFVPLILALFLFTFYHILKNKTNFGQFIYISLSLVILLSVFFSSVKKSVANYPILKQNFNGNMYYGYTEDWQNYLKLSAWCADSLPPNSLVACRKAPMSFIYARGKEFFPVYRVDNFSTDPDTLLLYLKTNKVTHILIANLRRNPKVNDGTIINTVHRVIKPVADKYPQKLTLIKQIGSSEPAYLYRINY